MSIVDLGLSDILFSKARRCVLGLLYANPDKDFYTNEIIRFANIGTGAIQKELKQLTTVGLIITYSIGNQKRYKANQASPVFKELRDICLKTFGLADIVRESFISLSNNIQIAFIYGSIAKQTDTINSDIDIMIIGTDLTYSDCFNSILEAETKLERKVNPTFCTPDDWSQKIKNKNNFISNILKQPKIFLIGTEDELKKLG